jgi:hypothetical protein
MSTAVRASRACGCSPLNENSSWSSYSRPTSRNIWTPPTLQAAFLLLDHRIGLHKYIRPLVRPSTRARHGEPALRRASEAVVEWMLLLPLVLGSGLGFEASADMVSIDTSRHVYLARQYPGDGALPLGATCTSSKSGALFAIQPLPLMKRQVGAAIDRASA